MKQTRNPIMVISYTKSTAVKYRKVISCRANGTVATNHATARTDMGPPRRQFMASTDTRKHVKRINTGGEEV